MAGDDNTDTVAESALSRKKRKEEARRLKRQRIEEAGGVRPRAKKRGNENHNKKHDTIRQHRFGRVMDQVPCRNKPRFSTLSVALPGSVVSNCQTRELRTHLVGQIARAATIYHVDEIVVFDDKLSNRNDHHRRHNDKESDAKQDYDPHTFMARVLQYCECPQYLRRHFFPRHRDLQFVGLLPPMDAPHHVRVDDHCKYREGVVLDKTSASGNSVVNCGLRKPVEIDTRLTPDIRCTVQIDSYTASRGKVVSPSAPREDNGTYWGYTTRLASSIHAVFDECPFGQYDLKIGTSERGDTSLERKDFELPAFKHALIVFGGVAGIEECVDADETMKLPGSESKRLFDLW